MAKKVTATTTPNTKASPASAKPPAGKAAGKTSAISAKPPAGRTLRNAPTASPKTGKAAPPPAAPVAITLKQLAAQIGENHELPPRQAQAVLNGVIDLLVEHLRAGDKLRLKGLGILEVKNRPARTARNPATGEPVKVPASKKITFRPAKDLKAAILG